MTAGPDTVVIVHGLWVHGLDHGAQRPVPLINASVNRFGYGGGAWRLQLWGDISHLSADQVTVYRGAAA